MRILSHSPVLAIALIVLIFMTGCGLSQLFAPPTPLPTPTPVRPLVPTFTPTPVLTPTPSPAQMFPPQPAESGAQSSPTPQQPAVAQPPSPTPTPPPPTPTSPPPPTPTPTPYVFIDRPRVNVRRGPGTNYPIMGQLVQGNTAPIVARDPGGRWWQICCVNGQRAWIAGWVVEARGNTNGVPIAQNIPTPPPTPTPRPTPAPTPTPSPSYVFYPSAGPVPLASTNPILTVWVKVANADNIPLGDRTVRLLRAGATVAEATSSWHYGFTRPSEDFGFFYQYNVKMEIPNPAAGEYQVVVVQGNQESSPRVTFFKSADTPGAEFFIAFQSR